MRQGRHGAESGGDVRVGLRHDDGGGDGGGAQLLLPTAAIGLALASIARRVWPRRVEAAAAGRGAAPRSADEFTEAGDVTVGVPTTRGLPARSAPERRAVAVVGERASDGASSSPPNPPAIR